LLSDGVPTLVLEEERFNREKHTLRFPFLSLTAAFDGQGLDIDDAWTVGVSYAWKSLTFDVRYWDTDLSDNACVVQSGFADGCDGRVVATISLDLAWSALRNHSHGTTESAFK
jgi:predicted NodU family carbamoyl transferase